MVISKEDTRFSAISFSQVLISSLSFPGRAPELQAEKNEYNRNKNHPITSKFNLVPRVLSYPPYRARERERNPGNEVAPNFTSKMHSLAFHIAEFTKWCLKITFCNPTWSSFRVDRNSSCYLKRVQISAPLVHALSGKKCYISTVLSLGHKSHTITHRPGERKHNIFSENGVQAFPRENRNCP